MTDKQKRFCEEYIIDCNGTQAAIRAGYSKKAARQIADRLMSKADIRGYVDERLEQIRNEKTAEAREVLEYLTSVMRGEHTEQVLKLSEEGGQVITDINVSEKDRLKAAELIGKRYGLFKENVDVNGTMGVTIVDDI